MIISYLLKWYSLQSCDVAHGKRRLYNTALDTLSNVLLTFSIIESCFDFVPCVQYMYIHILYTAELYVLIIVHQFHNMHVLIYTTAVLFFPQSQNHPPVEIPKWCIWLTVIAWFTVIVTILVDYNCYRPGCHNICVFEIIIFMSIYK